MTRRVVSAAVSLCIAFGSHAANAQSAGGAQQAKSSLSLSAGWEHLRLGAVEFGGAYDVRTPPNHPLVNTNKQHDGSLDGLRLDFTARRSVSLFGAPRSWLGLRAFHAWHDVTTAASCTTVNNAGYCDNVPLFDPSPVTNTTLGAGTGETVTYATDRDVRHWGVSLEVGSGPVVELGSAGWQPRFGLGYRTIDQELDLTSSWSRNATRRQSYQERLRTHYLGAFVGLDGSYGLGRGLTLKLSGEAGAYWAHTNYQGNLDQNDSSGRTVQALRLQRDDAAFIGSLKAELEQRFDRFTLSGFVRGEYYSVAPEMAYNQLDAINSGVDVLQGPNTGTSIDNNDAWSVTVGARVTVKLGSNE